MILEQVYQCFLQEILYMLISLSYRRVFYIDSSTTPSIKVIYLTNNRIETLENYDVSNPIFLHFDRRKDT